MQPGTGYITLSWVSTLCVQMPMLLNRLYVRRQQRRDGARLTWIASDILVTGAWLFNIALISNDTLTYTLGGFQPDLSALSLEAQITIYKGYFAGLAIYWVPFYFIKTAILLFYIEVVPTCLRNMRIAVYVCFVCVIGGFLFTELNLLLVCRPISIWWDVTTASLAEAAPCLDAPSIPVAVGWHMLTDLYVYAIPFFLIRKINVPSGSKKTTTFLIMASGFVSVLASIPVFLSYIVPALWDPFMWFFYVCVAESTTAMTVACLPALRITILRIYMKKAGKSCKSNSLGTSTINEMAFTTKEIRQQLEGDVDVTALTSVEGTVKMSGGGTSVVAGSESRSSRGINEDGGIELAEV